MGKLACDLLFESSSAAGNRSDVVMGWEVMMMGDRC